MRSGKHYANIEAQLEDVSDKLSRLRTLDAATDTER
jgi:hypothetical protein